MKAKRCNILLTVFLYLVLGMILLMLFVLLEFINAFTFLGHFQRGILKDIFIMIWIIGLIIPMLCYKKMKRIWMLPLCLILSTIMTTAVNYGALYATFDYISVYSREKWDNYPSVRYYMLDNLKEQYDFIGMTEQELTEILGEPTYIIKCSSTKYKGCTAYQYMIGDDSIDGYTYDFIFDNAIVIDTSVSQT